MRHLRTMIGVALISCTVVTSNFAQFTTVVNVPPDPAPSFAASGTQLNLNTGGSLPAEFRAASGSEVNIYGGLVNYDFTSYGTVNVTGGSVKNGAYTYGSSIMSVSGGTVDNVVLYDTATLNITGGSASFDTYGYNHVNISGGTVPGAYITESARVTISGGSIGANLEVIDSSQVHMSGGSIGDNATFSVSSELDLSGGIVGETLTTNGSARLNISGGAIGRGLQVLSAPMTTITGNDFRLDGVPVWQSALNQSDLQGAIFTGVLADGTPFVFEGGSFQSGISLTRVSLPAVGPATITASTDPVPYGIRQGQTLIADTGSSIRNDFNADSGSTVQVQPGATVGANLNAVGATLNVTGGSVGDGVVAYLQSTVNVSGGTVGANVAVSHGGTLNITGGSVGDGLFAENVTATMSGGSLGDNAVFMGHVTISGGHIGSNLRIHSFSTVAISGGKIEGGLRIDDQGSVDISGGVLGTVKIDSPTNVYGSEFRVNGQPIADLAAIGSSKELNLFNLSPSGPIISGVLADGTPFIFSSDSDQIDAVFHTVAVPSNTPGTFHASSDPIPAGLRQGQNLIVDAPGVVGTDFTAGYGSAVQLLPNGTIGDHFEAEHINLAIQGGSMGQNAAVYGNSAVTMTGGTVGSLIVDNGTFNMSAGTISGELENRATTVSISGGTISGYVSLQTGSTATINGGSIYAVYEDANSSANVSNGDLGQLTGSGTVAISGGNIGYLEHDGVGTRITITGGTFSGADLSRSDSTITGGRFGYLSFGTGSISGGVIGDQFTGGSARLVGGEFRINGVLIPGTDVVGALVPLSVPDGAVFSGVLADGTPFAFSTADMDNLGTGMQLQVANLPAAAPTTFVASVGQLPTGLRTGQTLIVDSGGVVPDDFTAAYQSNVTVQSGGIVGHNFEAVRSNVTISGGVIGDAFDAMDGSTVTMTGGTVGNSVDIIASTVTISGGSMGLASVKSGSTLNLSGGQLNSFLLSPGGTVNVTGGTVTQTPTFSGGVANISGGTFMTKPGVTSGVANISGGTFTNGLMVVGTGVANFTGGTFGVAPTIAGGTANFLGGTISSKPNVSGGIVNISGGTLANGLSLANSGVVNVTGGTLGGVLSVVGGTVNIRGGTLTSGASLTGSGVVNVSGGTLSGVLAVAFGAANISGGALTAGATLTNSGTANVSGGSIGDFVTANSGTTFHLYGVSFTGAPELASLAVGQTITVATRNVILRGILADASPFDFELKSTQVAGHDFFPAGAKVMVTRLALPTGDYNGNGIVDAADYVAWRNSKGQTVASGTGADGNHNGVIDDGDYDTWRANIGRTAASSGAASGVALVPEPSGIALLFGLGLCLSRRNDRGRRAALAR